MSDLLPLISTEENNEEIRTDLPPLPKKVFVVDPKTDEQLEEEDASNSVGYEEESDPKVESEQFMDPNHPLLERVQKAIHDQLTAHIESLELDLRVKQEGADREMRRREDAGVQLYNLQQHLAKIQASYEAGEENFRVIKALRADSERILVLAKKEYEAEKERVGSHYKNLDSHQNELEKIHSTLRQVELYKEELRSKILVAKRTTLKTEKDLAKQEIEKKRQDFYIERLTVQLKKLQMQKSVYDSQMEIQKRETKAALTTLRDAATEMEAIQFEKKQLLNQWNSTLLGLKKRDDMVASIQTEITKNDQQLQLLASEISGLKKSMGQAQTEGENLSTVLAKLENEIEFINSQMNTRHADKEKMAETYQLLEKTLKQTEQDFAVSLQEESKIRLEINSVKKSESQTVTKIQSLDHQLYEKLQLHNSLDMGASSTARDSSQLRSRIEDKQGEIIAAENEISLITLETLELSNTVEILKSQLLKIDQSISGENTAIQNYEQDFKILSDQIKKKASQMDLLNKKLGSLTSEQVHTGPLEATIASLIKSIAALDKDQLALQTRYLQVQTELVKTNGKCQILDSEIDTQNLLKTSLVRQNTIIDSALRTENVEINNHSRNITALHVDLTRVSTILHSQGQLQSSLGSDNLILKSALKDKLKQAEMNYIDLESALAKLKSDKSAALDSIIEADRQYMLWDSKYSLAKEMSATLDPSTGSSELGQMSQEIYRMGLRYKSMLAIQERMVSEMEKGVYRRSEIAKRSGKGNKGDSLQKTIDGLKTKLKTGIAEIKACEKEDLQNLEKYEGNVAGQISQSQEAFANYDEKSAYLDIAVETLLTRKQMLSNATLIYQKLTKRYRDLLDGKSTVTTSGKTIKEKQKDLESAKGRIEKVSNAIADITKDADQSLQSVLNEYSEFLKGASVEI